MSSKEYQKDYLLPSEDSIVEMKKSELERQSDLKGMTLEEMLQSKQEEGGTIYPFAVFCLIGITQLVGWNNLLNSGYNVATVVWGASALPSSVTALYTLMNAIITILSVYYTEFFVKSWVTIIGIALTIIDAILYALLTVSPGRIALPLMHVLGVTMGISSALISCSAYGYANYFPRSYGGALSAGLGVAGVVTFVAWMIAQYGFFNVTTVNGVIGANILLQAICLVIAVVSLYLLLRFFRLNWVRFILNRYKLEAKVREEKQYINCDIDVPEKETFLDNARVLWFPGILYVYIMFITLLSFPSIGPSAWNATNLEKDISVGVFQVGDLIGRYLPCVFPILVFNISGVAILALLRTLLFVTAVLSWKIATPPLLNSAFLWFQMLALSVTNGWCLTSLLIQTPKLVKSAEGKARAGTMSLLGIVIGLTAGQWMAFLLLSIWK